MEHKGEGPEFLSKGLLSVSKSVFFVFVLASPVKLIMFLRSMSGACLAFVTFTDGTRAKGKRVGWAWGVCVAGGSVWRAWECGRPAGGARPVICPGAGPRWRFCRTAFTTGSAEWPMTLTLA